MRAVILFALVLLTCVAGAGGQPPASDSLPAAYVPPGSAMFKGYCASCHGLDAKGQGPFAPMLKVPPANLTTLAKRHGGKFPYEYVTGALRSGPKPITLHGSAAMPVWGTIFQYFDKNDERAVQQRIKNLCDYLASVQTQ